MNNNEDLVTKVHKLMDHYYPHKDSYKATLNLIKHYNNLRLDHVIWEYSWYKERMENDREAQFQVQAIQLIRHEINSPLFKAMQELEEDHS